MSRGLGEEGMSLRGEEMAGGGGGQGYVKGVGILFRGLQCRLQI